MNNTKNSTYVEISTLQNEFNAFLMNNMDYFTSNIPFNPSLAPDDEWRTGDYSDYDKLRSTISD